MKYIIYLKTGDKDQAIFRFLLSPQWTESLKKDGKNYERIPTEILTKNLFTFLFLIRKSSQIPGARKLFLCFEI